MSNSNLLLICSVFLFFSFASSSYLNTTTTTHQCSALLLFKQNLSSFNFSIDFPPFDSPCEDWLGSEGYYPIMMNWNTSTTDCCHWDGVACDHSTGDVIGLDLSCGMLQGTLHPNTSLFNLPRLQTLNLAFNDFYGSKLPREIGRFSSTLTHLNISSSWFSGKVPTDITLLHKLVSLDLSRNYDIRLEPRVFINMLRNYTSLEQLSLEFVIISSSLPAHLNISSSLKLLNLQRTGLHGNLPDNIFKLHSLEKLDLAWNSFAGQIPWEITLLPKLVSLDLSENVDLQIKIHTFTSLLQNSTRLTALMLRDVYIGLVLPTYLNISSSLKTLGLSETGLKGKLPDNIFSLQYLETLYLSENTDLTGPLPRVNATMPPLKQLSLGSTSLSGEIPDSIGHFKSLTHLDLSNCSFTGPLPKSIVNLRHLTFLHLSSNKLNGIVPSSLFSLRSLEGLSLENNQFDGPILQTFPQLTNLIYLYLSYNNFSGDLELDTFLSGLTNLLHLDLSYSGLSVTTSNANHHVSPNFMSLLLVSCKLKVFPKILQSMRNLKYLDLSSNEIHGQIPQWAGEIGGIGFYHLNLSHNFITGLPQFQWYPHGLQALYLQSNMVQGPFPPSICNLSYLRYLDMSNNSFDGVIPQCFGNITSSLLMINLRNNHFQGSIPNVYENCGGLEGLILNGNKLVGELPSSLSKCQSLKVLDIGNNHLNGTFPHWLGSLPNLQVLVLKLNSFHGPIVPSSTDGFPFQSLQVFDLSYNRFVGQLPGKYFQNFNAMKNGVNSSTKLEYLNTDGKYYTISVSMKGREQFFPQIFVGYKIVCLSHNNFVGGIPDIIGILNSLKALDLSHNSLTGRIPQAIGNLSQIESLDLSWNELTGRIPQSLADLTFLGFLNLSQNHLVGLIPVGKQLNTFQENSFEGNPNLCGLPLPKQCNKNLQETHIEGDGDADEEESGFTWRAVMLGYGCGTLFGLVMGYLMLSTGRPMWFNAIADAAEQMILKRRNKKRYIYIGR